MSVLTEKLDEPATVRNEEADIHVEDGQSGVFVSRGPVDNESDYSEEVEEATNKDAITDKFVDLVVLVFGV